MTHMPSVLFVCVHNAGRSQMAAALLNHHAMGRVEVRSAGSAPKESVNPAAVRALQQWGIDITGEEPKILDPLVVENADVVVTMGCGDACPIFPATRYEDWSLEDPAGKSDSSVKKIRDEIDQRVRSLLSELID
tara:strand:+ start:4513 stop:4914 length:402 start_codon:yes stop_codon:yes gene_type:complete